MTIVEDVDVLDGWLTEAYDYERPRRGQVRQGEILKIEESGVIVDLGLKRDGFVPRADLERLDAEALSPLELGQEITARIVRLEDNEGNLVLSVYKARFEQDWERAQELLESGDIWRGEVTGHNRGGLTVKFGHLNAFLPASHLAARGRQRWSPEQRQAKLEAYLGQELPFKIIEVDRDRRRLILSERVAKQQMRDQNKENLLNKLQEGQICRATVSGLTHYGAFVDLGGADGLIHVSELAWRRVRHPKAVLKVGDEIDVCVIRLDHERKRIGLSLKRLQPDPWELVDQTYTLDQLVSGTVTNVVDFGAFVALDLGVEGLVHISELADPPPPNPRELLQPGDELVLRIVRIDSFRQRIGLSLKRVSESEREEWLSKQAGSQTPQLEAENGSSSGDEEHQATWVESTAKDATSDRLEEAWDGKGPQTAPPPFAKQPQEESYWISLIQDEEEKEV